MLCCFFAVATTFVNAQDGNGRGRMMEMMKQKLKDDLKFTDVQIDSVLAVQMDYQAKSRQVRMDNSMGDDQKKAAMEKFAAERHARLKNTLSDEEIKKLDAVYEEMRKARQNRQGNN